MAVHEAERSSASRSSQGPDGSGGARGGHGGREAEMAQDPSDHPRILDDRDQTKTAAALRAVEHIESEAPGH
jgi:hypothetical protein